MSKEPTRISFLSDPEKLESLGKIAEVYGKNLSMVINEALDRYIELHDWQASPIREKADGEQDGDFATD